ncbi:hypothetical protein T265_02800 [Opisthorchis viverrini]|uniref:Uncharacterized protein n=1 Tax=Opisthorchis viverrini TaxID=6198 RepID=A0A075A5I4_OPIVI|nr:hypothetical protein T265_02800 [Opisthorchis viverrini]KER30875.1 hypothetical protein T265_02800 [Opisthorchis viverrini]
MASRGVGPSASFDGWGGVRADGGERRATMANDTSRLPKSKKACLRHLEAFTVKPHLQGHPLAVAVEQPHQLMPRSYPWASGNKYYISPRRQLLGAVVQNLDVGLSPRPACLSSRPYRSHFAMP